MMKKKEPNRKMDRRLFLKQMALAGGAAFITTSPTRIFAQGGKERIPAMQIMYYTVLPEQEDIWKLVTQDWRKLGLECKLNVRHVTVAINAAYNKHEYGDMISISVAPNPERIDPYFLLEHQLHSKHAALGGRNFGYYKNPEFDKYCDLQNAEMDRNKRRELVWKCQEIQAKDYPCWWMAYGANIQAYNSKNWEGVVDMPGAGIGTKACAWTYLNIKSKTKRNILRVADFTDQRTLNIFATGHSATQQGLRFVYDTYTKLSPDIEAVPWAAESWRIVNPKTVDITLRSGMKFHDGKPVTVQDVKFTWDYIKKWKFPLWNWVTDQVERTEILDDRNFRFHLVKPRAAFIEQTLNYAVIIPKHIWEKIPESVGLDSPLKWENPECIGSGFFKFGHMRKSEEIYFKANKEHWHAPKIDGVVFRLLMTPDAMVSALRAGEADIIGGQMRVAQAKELEGTHFKTVISPNTRLWMARADMRRKRPFADRQFRLALYHAIDVKKIHEVVLEGAGNPGRNTPISPVLKFWHNPNLPAPEFSIEKARKVLKEAGYSWDNEGRLCFPV